MDIPNVNNILTSKIKIDLQQDKINLYYGKNRLYAKTGCWVCPYGLGDNNTLTVVVPDNYCEHMYKIDNIGRTVVRNNYETIFGTPAPEDDDEMPYIPLIKTLEDGSDVMNVRLSDKVRVFDKNGEYIPDHASCLSSQFSAYYLLDLSALSIYNGYVTWQVWPIQIKVKQYCVLPEGCLILNSLDEVDGALKQRIKVKVKSRSVDDLDAVVDFDPDANELMD